MRQAERERQTRRIVAQAVEQLGVDAVVLVTSTTTRRRTVVHLNTWGNQLACSGLAEQAYAQLCEGLEEVEEEDESDD